MKEASSARQQDARRRVIALQFPWQAALILVGLSAASAQTVTTFNATATSTETFPTAINLGGTVAGYFIDATGFHDFLRAPNGTITTFNPPADSATSGSTVLFGLNNPGAVVGWYTNPSFVQTGYLRDPSGNFTDIAPPGSTLTSVNSINDAGQIAGSWVDSALPHKTHGFVRSPTGTYTSFDVPGATGGVTVASINSSGQIAGFYFDSTFHSHGFVRASTGTITTFDAPSPFPNIVVFSMNDNGEVSGDYNDGTTYHGYVRRGTTITPFEGDPARTETFPQAINAAGTVVGDDCVGFNNCNGFVRSSGGTITSLEVPTASNTLPSGVNALATIAGVWLDASFSRHGFLATFTQPSPPSSGTSCNGTYNSTFTGNVIVSAGETCNFIGGGITGSVTLLGGTLGLSGATVGGNVQITGGSFAIGPSTTIDGTVLILDVARPSSQNQICGATVRGDVVLLVNETALEIGQGTTACPGNTVSGDVAVLNSNAATTVVGNSIAGSLVCFADSSITGSGNTVAGRKLGECATF